MILTSANATLPIRFSFEFPTRFKLLQLHDGLIPRYLRSLGLISLLVLSTSIVATVSFFDCVGGYNEARIRGAWRMLFNVMESHFALIFCVRRKLEIGILVNGEPCRTMSKPKYYIATDISKCMPLCVQQLPITG